MSEKEPKKNFERHSESLDSQCSRPFKKKKGITKVFVTQILNFLNLLLKNKYASKEKVQVRV